MKRTRIDEPDRLDRFMKSFSQGHSQDFKAVALKLVATGQSIEHVAVLLGVGSTTLYEWIGEWNKKKSLVSETDKGKEGEPKHV
jgi:transposase